MVTRLEADTDVARDAVTPDVAAGTGTGAAPDWDAVFDAVPHLLALIDADGRIVRINAAGAALLGTERSAIVGRLLRDDSLWPEGAGDAGRMAAALARTRADGTADAQIVQRDEAGAQRVIEFSFIIVPAQGGVVPGILLEGRDVTDRINADRALRLAHEKFAGMFAISADAIITIDEQQRIIDFNAAAEQIFGWTAAEVRGRPLDMLIPERFRTVHSHHVRAFAASPVEARRMGERSAIEGLRRNGRSFPAEASISKLEVDGQRIATVVLRDVTERQRAESAQRILARSGALLAHSLDEAGTLERIAELIVESLADACVIFEVDVSGTIRRAATAAADADAAALLAPLVGRTIPPDESHPIHVLIETQEPVSIGRIDGSVFMRDGRAGETRPLMDRLGLRSAVFAPLMARGGVRGAIGLYSRQEDRFSPEDVALARELAVRAGMALDNARLYREAVEAVRARDDVLAVVSHDLGNPLSAIRIGVSLLLRSRPADAQSEGAWAHLAGIQQSVEQMERLIRDLLEVKRIEAGYLTLTLDDHPASELLADAVELMAPLADRRAMRVRVVAVDGSPRVRADRERTLQVLTNLLGNAIKFTQEGGEIELTAFEAGGEVTFSVRDNGPGIAAPDVHHIFDRFWQAQRKGREGLGLGLGLAIVRGIVQAHGGRTWAESEIGVGTTISFTLPAARPDGDPER